MAARQDIALPSSDCLFKMKLTWSFGHNLHLLLSLFYRSVAKCFALLLASFSISCLFLIPEVTYSQVLISFHFSYSGCWSFPLLSVAYFLFFLNPRREVGTDAIGPGFFEFIIIM